MKAKIVASIPRYVFLLMAIGLSFASNAQKRGDANIYTKPNKPHMWAQDDPKLIQNFIKIKLPQLNNHPPGSIQPVSFKLGNFLGMIQYFKDKYPLFKCLHVYIATFSNESSPNVPPNCGNLLTLIFAPASEYDPVKETDLDYFIIPPGEPFNKNNINDFQIDRSKYIEWTTNYIGSLMPFILNTIDKTETDNLHNGKLSDTKCITYCKQDLSELVEEQTYVHYMKSNPNIKIPFSTDMLASFAAFGPSGNVNNHGKGEKRLFVQFDFIDTGGKTIYLEDTDGFSQRDSSTVSCAICKGFPLNDNGQLCPPSENCPIH